MTFMKQMVAPDQLIGKVYKALKPSWKTAFISAVVIGIVTHIYALTNTLLTWDSMWNLYSDQDMLSSGRPFLTYMCGISSYFNLPLVNGLLGILFLGITAAVIVEIFHIESPIFIVLTSGMLVKFTTISSTICYMYTFDGYMLALLLSTLAFLVTDRKKHGWMLGAVLLALSIGTYQAYMSFTIVICILTLLLELIEEDSIKVIWIKIRNDMTMGIVGYVLYVISVKVMQAVKNVELSGYSGTDRIDSIVISDIPRGIYEAYHNFASFAFSGNVLTTNGFMAIAFYVIILLCVVMYIIAFVKNGRLKRVDRMVLAVLLVVFLPLGATIVCVMFPDTFVYLLLRMPWALLFIFGIVLAERYTLRMCMFQEKPAIACQWICVVSTFVMVFNFFLMSNIAYYNMNERYEKSYSLCLRIVDRIEQMEEYHPWVKVAFVGGFPDYNKYPTTEATLEVLRGYYASRSDYVLDKTDSYVSFMKHYLNVSLLEATDEEESTLSQMETVQNMGTFPAQDSVRMVDGILVIKMR